MTLVTVLAVSGAAGTAPTARDAAGPAGSASVLPQPPRVEKLDNGLTLVLVPWDSPGIVAYQTTVRVGSRDEVEEGHTGFAHLFEHMMFRGTAKYPKDVYERAIQVMGADNNAFTWFDLTNYYLLAPTSALPKLIDIEADRFQRLEYSEADYRTETGAVHGEYNKNASSPGQIMEEALLETAFRKHTYGHSTMGYLADIKKMPGYYEYSRAFLTRFYTPDNAIVTVVGDFDGDEVLRLVKAAYGGWSGTRDQPEIPIEPPQQEPRQRHVDWSSPTAPRMTLAYRIPSFSLADRTSVSLDVLRELLFGTSSPLYQRLAIEEKKVLAMSAPGGLWAPPARDPFLFVVDLVLQPGTRFEEIEAAVTDAVARVASGEVDAQRVADVRSHLRYAFATGLESPQDVALAFAMLLAGTGDPGAIEAYPSRLAEVTPEDVQKVAEEWLVPEHRTIVTLAHTPAAGDGAGEAAPAEPSAKGGAR
jgi:zinc protease